MDNLYLLKKKDSTLEKKANFNNKINNSYNISKPIKNPNVNTTNSFSNDNNEKFVFNKNKDLMPLILLIIGVLLITIAFIL